MAYADLSKKPWIIRAPLQALLLWTPDGAGHFAKWTNGWAFDPLVTTPIAILLFVPFAAYTDPGAVAATFVMLVYISPAALPVGLFFAFWTAWMRYIRYTFWFNNPMILLEIQLPPEVEKTPAAMELFLAALWNTGGETTFIQRIWKGQFRPVWTLEIVGSEGQVRFYLHLRKAWKNIVEARLYGQYPEAKIVEAEDYAAKINFNLDEYELFGSEYEKGGAVAQALPIRTYVDYGLHMSPDKPEQQVDPITNTLELLGSIGKDEHFWLQIIIRPRKADEWYGFYLKEDKYREPAHEEIKKITEGAIKRAQALTDDESEKKKVGTRGAMLLTGGEKLRVESIERSLTKLIFECGFRVVYFAKRTKYNGINAGAIIRFFDAFRYPDYNALGVTRGTTYFDYPWQDWGNIRKSMEKRNLFNNYRHRAYFYVPLDQKPVFMTTEELATLWHFPSSVVKTPALDRVASRRAEAPQNLPVAPL
ncbi:hypothetical protein A2852_02510 [Candidatus Adlerbacteria bacterium RIFCSPHIGHO2_01_FULL_54_23]|uniref:Uncharacterized protein n=3 Tax=Candidatus Adleribacteriota TaxID=1752736 RepID=A0A1F4Y1E0_9BACT|nr:MAG: hypothetical protein UY83_C0002G0024 [Candidatus Adlerbacteria bacterium GW2011_GWA1_54_10]KKW37991.1 MAG: hypothetical protein UY86_C0002G0088 [Candidatus Adlerbacteria bacterium GW2011_GWB1_54_7]OGC78598.1 MAG: hypothetical protein A2852_02510 [Candidatus Adlerbacteria bacterium RIFCSPHIGHO2_01_FULL_54_23]OGC87606.1 MAG: hypothetical protein A3B33_01705 [Candidatus Adlerbacteria bacterium RIFCSPLOWO2_01_FULL_54_16]